MKPHLPLPTLLLTGALLWGLGNPEPGRAQQSSPCDRVEGRPCVALVLGGGGAKGGVHIGVLEVLEEMRVPVDVVVGSSMGAVVGGIYAAGYDAAGLREALGGVDWNQMFAARPPRRDVSMRRKGEDYNLTVDLELGVRGLAPVFPTGLLPDQNLDFLLQNLTQPVADRQDFDDLPTPFRAAAADVINGELVVLDRGSLPNAIRASMSLAGVFSPVPWEGRLLVDGAVALNLPVDIAVALGADVIIASELEPEEQSVEDFQTLLAVTGQMNRILMGRPTAGSRALLDEDDVYITPNPVGISAAAFDRVMETVPYGVEAAREETEGLSRLSLDPEAWEAWKAQRAARSPALAEPVIDFIRVAGSDALNPEAVLSRVTLQPGDVLDAEILHRDLGRIHGLGWYERVGYRLVQEGGDLGLEILLQDKPWGPHYLRTGLALKDNLSGLSAFRLTLSYLTGPINGRGGEFRLNTVLGEPLSISADVFQPLDNRGRWFVAAEAGIQRFTSDPAFKGETAAITSRGQTIEGSVGFGFNVGSSFEFRVSPTYTGLDGEVSIIPGALLDVEIHEYSLATRALLDRFNHPFFPTKGSRGQLLWIAGTEEDFSPDGFQQLVGEFSVAGSRGRHALQLGVEAGSSLGTAAPFYRTFSVGGFGRISGLGAGRVSGLYYGLAGARYDFTLKRLPDYGLLRRINLMATAEAGNAWTTSSQVDLGDLLHGGSASLALDTLLGPIFVGVGYSTGGEVAWYVSLGGLL